MQDIVAEHPVSTEQLVQSISLPRLSAYLNSCNGDVIAALDLYRWNARVSQSFYVYLQAWEVCLRNKLNLFLVTKFGPLWPHDLRFARVLSASDRRKVADAVRRQEAQRNITPAITSAVVADLSAGFWVSQLSYDVAYSWRHNISQIFPNDAIKPGEAHAACASILSLRNRIAHHEPVFNQPLEERHADLRRIVFGMCAPTQRFADSMCTFAETMKAHPRLSL
jgi:hypothetical protein